ncbi:MFS general substrate transporter [Auriculariales sp. MPI-PUGE-AT-0066]|nr:MFS general substrate transporter [Auriculariales sp. MPI-PUGE-AT-0066]
MSMSTLDDLDSKLQLDDKSGSPVVITTPQEFSIQDPQPQYRLYKRRWAGLVALFFLNIAPAAAWPYFGAITIATSKRFGFTTNEVNWLGNSVSIMFLPVSVSVPLLVKKFGVRNTCLGAAFCLLISAWVRFAGTADSLSVRGRYALMLFAQILVGVPQSIFQVIGPTYSEQWFDVKFRTTATMIIAISNPLGAALGQLISPILDDPKDSILLLGIIGTVIAPLAFLIGRAPALPPTFAASTPSIGLTPMLRALVGKARDGEPHMDKRERLDFVLLVFIFGICVQCASTFSLLSNEMLEPYGYNSDQAGFVGAALLFSGIIAAALAAPLLDRVLTHHLNIVIRVLVPSLAAGWIGWIFAVKKDGLGGLFANAIAIGICSLILLPTGLEVGVEVSRNSEASSAIIWCFANTMDVIFIPIFQALRAGDNADPPRNHRRGLIVNASLMGLCSVLVFGIRGRQRRRELDIEKMRERQAQGAQDA